MHPDHLHDHRSDRNNARQIALGDIDRDGDLDLYVPDDTGGRGALFVNDGTASFVDETASRLDAFSAKAGAARFGDLDVTETWTWSSPMRTAKRA